MALQRRLGGRSDAALRHVHNAPQRDRIERIDNRGQIRHHILDFGALVELRATEHAIGKCRADEDFLKRPGLRVRAIEDRDVLVAEAFLAQGRDLIRNELGLVVLAVAGESDDLLAVANRREQVLVLAVEVVRDDTVGRAEDVLGRPIVLLEQDDFRVGEVALELDDVADVRAAERIDRLIRVADNRQRRARNRSLRSSKGTAVTLARFECLSDLGMNRLGQLPDQRVLGVVGVLVLVDQDVPIPPLVQRGDLREGAEQVHRLSDQVVEVEGVRAGETARVLTEDLQEHPLGRVIEVRPARVGFYVVQLVLEFRDPAGDRTDGEAEGVGSQILDDAFEERTRIGRVVDREAAREPEVLRFAPEDAHAGGVEGRDRHPLSDLAEQGRHALPHLGRCLVRERDGEDLARPRLAGVDQARDPPGEHARLPGAGSGDDQQGGPAVFDGFALLRVQSVEQVRGGGDGGHDPPILGWHAVTAARLLLRSARAASGCEVRMRARASGVPRARGRAGR